MPRVSQIVQIVSSSRPDVAASPQPSRRLSMTVPLTSSALWETSMTESSGGKKTSPASGSTAPPSTQAARLCGNQPRYLTH